MKRMNLILVSLLALMAVAVFSGCAEMETQELTASPAAVLSPDATEDAAMAGGPEALPCGCVEGEPCSCGEGRCRCAQGKCDCADGRCECGEGKCECAEGKCACAEGKCACAEGKCACAEGKCACGEGKCACGEGNCERAQKGECPHRKAHGHVSARPCAGTPGGCSCPGHPDAAK